MIPAFDPVFGLLPPGVHDAAWNELVEALGFSQRRQELLEGLRHACLNLRAAGATHVFVDGSFSSRKKRPGDWDSCYSAKGVDPSKLDPALKDYTNARAAMKAKFGGEMFIAEMKAAGLLGPPYLDFFQKDRGTGRKKGIIKLDLGTIP